MTVFCFVFCFDVLYLSFVFISFFDIFVYFDKARNKLQSATYPPMISLRTVDTLMLCNVSAACREQRDRGCTLPVPSSIVFFLVFNYIKICFSSTLRSKTKKLGTWRRSLTPRQCICIMFVSGWACVCTRVTATIGVRPQFQFFNELLAPK